MKGQYKKETNHVYKAKFKEKSMRETNIFYNEKYSFQCDYLIEIFIQYQIELYLKRKTIINKFTAMNYYAKYTIFKFQVPTEKDCVGYMYSTKQL